MRLNNFRVIITLKSHDYHPHPNIYQVIYFLKEQQTETFSKYILSTNKKNNIPII